MTFKNISCFFLIMGLFLYPAAVFAKTVDVTISHQKNSTTPLVDVYIEGNGPYKFLLDTGAGMSSVSHRLAQKLSLKNKNGKSIKVLTVKGHSEIKATNMLSLEVTRKKIKTRSRLLITPPNDAHSHDGVLGLNDLRGAVIVNDPAAKKLHLTLPSKIPSCDALSRLRRCGIHPRDMPTIPVQLGSQPALLIFDTGYTGSSPIIMFKSDYTNQVWGKVPEQAQTLTPFSDLPLKRVLSQDFNFAGNANCYADFYIRSPNDSSGRFREVAGLLGWWTIKDAAFTLDLNTMTLDYPSAQCPYKTVNTLGIGGFGAGADIETIFIGNLAADGPAYRAGLRDQMEIERIYLANGTIIDTFEDGLRSTARQHVHSRPGTRIGFDVINNGITRRINVTAERPAFTALD